MRSRFLEKAMTSFIGAIIVLGLFGPWLISLLLAAVCGGCWYAGREPNGRRKRQVS
ncbi:MAG: hypothetical protein JWN93_1899 [Hyphomicrobiales bacterium]|jgi:hypothetical protein|nr:hypothetical protein [Hyphomicrobiales bacterium]